MLEIEALAAHDFLWNCNDRYFIFRHKPYRAIRVHNDRKDYNMLRLPQNITIVSQNLKKDSPNTAWCLQDSSRKLSWIIKGDRYIGKIETEKVDDEILTKVWKLSPDELLLTRKG